MLLSQVSGWKVTVSVFLHAEASFKICFLYPPTWRQLEAVHTMHSELLCSWEGEYYIYDAKLGAVLLYVVILVPSWFLLASVLPTSLLVSLVPRLSQRARTKNRKKRGEPIKIYVRKVIGRENLITCGLTNELAHALWAEYIRSVAIALWPIELD